MNSSEMALNALKKPSLCVKGFSFIFPPKDAKKPQEQAPAALFYLVCLISGYGLFSNCDCEETYVSDC